MLENRNILDKFFLVLKGIAMGTANKIPGVSGGVVAFVAGFYEEFIHSLNQINRNALRLLIQGKFKDFYSYVNGSFLTYLVLGMVISFFTVSRIIDYLLQFYELYVWACFFGMILGSLYYINKEFKDWNKQTVITLIVGIIIGAAISIPDPFTENRNLWFVFLCGVISISGMPLPGLSGSFIMMLLGNYVLLLVDSVNALADTFSDILAWNFDFVYNSDRVELLKILVLFTLGSVVGLVTLAHLLTFVLKKYHSITYASIIGFIGGSLGVVWPWKKTIRNSEDIVIGYQRYLPDFSLTENWWAIIYIIIGILLVAALELYGQNRKKY